MCMCAHTLTHTQENTSRAREKNKTRSLEDTAAHVIPGSAGLPPHSDGGTGRGEPTAVY